MFASIIRAALVPICDRIWQLAISLRQEITLIILLSLCVIVIGLLDGYYIRLFLKLLWINDLALRDSWWWI